MLTLRSAFILLVWLAAQPAFAVTLSGTARAVDGDTLDLSGQRVRLIGIDAPELDQSCQRGGQGWACGDWARDALRERIKGQAVACEATGQDRYGRWLATCRVGGRDLGQALVRDGVAFAYRRYSVAYVPDEERAARERRGLWQGEAEQPEAFRHADAGGAAQGCAIKGNISAGGRIFHSPGQRDYASTQINPGKGERWFCSASDAVAAGWRAARR